MGYDRWAAITCPAITTPSASTGFATYASSPVSATPVEGVCQPGYSGVVTRLCTGSSTQPGTWDTPVGACARTHLRTHDAMPRRPCLTYRLRFTSTAVECDAANFTSTPGIEATFPAGTLAGFVGIGTCAEGLFGLPQLTCLSNGTYDETSIVNPCSRMAWRIVWSASRDTVTDAAEMGGGRRSPQRARAPL
jgi:hypothetical protein